MEKLINCLYKNYEYICESVLIILLSLSAAYGNTALCIQSGIFLLVIVIRSEGIKMRKAIENGKG